MEGIELISFEIISNVGAARSHFINAIYSAREQKFAEAEELIKKGNEQFTLGHHAHAKLIQEESAGNHPAITLLLIHAEDQLMAAESFKLISEEFVNVYRQIQVNQRL